MNPRLEQITGQVLDEVVPETWVALKYDKIKEIQLRTAELIIQECADIGALYADGNYEVRNRILEHFGIEEEEW
jgi:hypothetical protein